MEKDNKAQDADNLIDEELVKRKKNIAELLTKAKGENRNFAEYAKAAGISPAALSRIVNGHYIPTPKTMKKLTSESASPQGGISYEDLMHAAGYESGNDPVPIIEDKTEDSSNVIKDNRRSPFSLEMQRVHAERQEYIRKGISRVYTALVEKEFVFRKKEEDVLHGERFAPDVVIEITGHLIRRWGFYFKYWPHERIHGNPTILDVWLSYILRLEMLKDTKVSLVINNDFVFQRMKRYEHALSIRGEVSIILYDDINDKLIEEYYLSNYVEGDQKKEIKLIDL